MSNDPLLSLWQSASPRKEPLDMRAIMRRSHGLRLKVRIRNLTESVACLWLIVVFGGVGQAAFRERDALAVFASLLTVAGAAYVLVETWRRAGNLTVASIDAPTDVWLSHHREELRRQLDALRSVPRWYVAPFVPGIVTFVLAVSLRAKATAFTTNIWLVRLSLFLGSLLFVAVVMGFVIWLNQRAARRIERTLNELRES